MSRLMRTPLWWIQLAVLAILVATIVDEVLIYSPPTQQFRLGLAVHAAVAQSSSSETQLEVRISGAEPGGSLRLVAFPLTGRPSISHSVYVFDYAGYPTANATVSAVSGIYDHLVGELVVRHAAPTAISVNDTQLRTVLQDTGNARGNAVAIMGGVMPVAVFGSGVDLITPWVRAGGILIWGGGTIGYWSSGSGTSVPDAAASLKEAGTTKLLGNGIVKYPWTERNGTVQTDLGSSLSISYRFASAGVQRDAVIALGGLSLGWYAGQYSSLSYLPSGAGGYLLFGGDVLDASSIAADLEQLLLSGAPAAAGPVEELNVSGLTDSTVHGPLLWTVPFAVPQSGLEFVAFDPNPDATFYYGTVVRQQ